MMLVFCLLVCFLLYFLSCSSTLNVKQRNYCLLVFAFSTFVLRYVVEPELNKDYFLYFNFKIFGRPTSVLSFMVNEPYLYMVYRFFCFFSNDKSSVFHCMYWFNHMISTSFFVWLILRKDVAKWKKIILFVLFYPVLDFVLLRNGPVYLLFAIYFYYSFRDVKFNYVLFTPFIHSSSLLLLPVYFHRAKNYYIFLFGFILLGIASFFVLMPYLAKMDVFRALLFKIHVYSSMGNLNLKMHTVFLGIILLATAFFAFIYKKALLHPVLLSTFLLYFVSFFFNVSVAYRLAVYYIFALFLFGSVKDENVLLTKWLNVLSVFLFPVLVYSLHVCHNF